MAESVRELVVTMSLDAGSFSKTCTAINNQIKGVEAQFNAITAGTGGWEKTLAGRKAKLDALTETFSAQQVKIATIASELERAKTALAADPGNVKAAQKVSGLETQLNDAKAAAALTKLEIEKLNVIKFTEFNRKMTALGTSLKNFGRKFSMYIGGPLAALGIKSFNLAQDYETAMVQLQNSTQGSEEQMLSLEESILQMTTEVPMSFTEIADLMKTLANADVPIANLEKVAREMIGLEAVSDVGAQESGKGIMQFLTILNEPLENVDKMSSSLFMLGISSVATGAEIFAMSQNMASFGKAAGLSAPEILALGASFSSMGIEAQAGGTAAGKLMKEFQLAVETGKGVHASAEQYASVLGVSVKQFKASWESMPTETMIQFFDGLATGAANGDASVLAMLQDLGLTEARLSNLITAASGNPKFFTRMLDTANQAWEDNAAIAKATADVYGTSESRTTLSLNKMENASADMGENIIEVVQPVIDAVGNLASEFGKLDEQTQSNWVKVGLALITLGPAAMFLGNVAKGAGALVGQLAKIDTNGVSNWSKLSSLFGATFGSGIFAAVAVGGSFYLLDQYLTSISDNTTTVIDRLKNIEIGLDETKYKAVTDALAQIQAQADALSGEKGEHNKNLSSAVKAGYGTESMFGTALGYESMLTEKEIGDLSGRYAKMIDILNGKIGAAKTKAEADAFYGQRKTVQKLWDMKVAEAKQNHMDQVSALVDGMMLADPEAKAALEQAARDYDVLAELNRAITAVMDPNVTAEQTDEIWKNFFSPSILGQYFDGLKYEDLVPGAAALDLENRIVLGMEEALKKAGGENSLAYMLLQTILDNPLASGTFDSTKTSGALDGIVELLDYKAAGEKAGTEYGSALTAGLADSIVAGTVAVVKPAATGMGDAVDTAISDRLGIRSPSTIMIAHGLNVDAGVAQGIIQGIPVASAAMTTLGTALIAIAAAQGSAAGRAYGASFAAELNAGLSGMISPRFLMKLIADENHRQLTGLGRRG